MGSKESSGSISTISQERPPHSEQMLICVNFKQFKSILGFSFTNLSNQCWNDSKDKYRIDIYNFALNWSLENDGSVQWSFRISHDT